MRFARNESVPGFHCLPVGGPMSLLVITALGLALIASIAGAAGPRAPVFTPPAGYVPDTRTRVDQVDLNKIGIRFEPQTAARARWGRLVSLNGTDLSSVERIIGAVPGATVGPRFDLGEAVLDQLRRRGEEKTKQELPDLNLFVLVKLPPARSEAAGKERLRGLLRDLNTAPGVAEAWALPVVAPAVVNGWKFSQPGLVPALPAAHAASNAPRKAGPRSDTPDFSPLQGYLYESPVGVWADSVWAFPGGKGQGIKVLGLEWGWLWNHEDLTQPFYVYNDQGPSDHGTAVLGIIGGRHNGYGVNGIAGEVQIGGIYLGDLASDILRTATVLSPGDMFNMSIQVSGPENWMPTEWWGDCFAAIQTVSAQGIICMEAAGNGSVNLDDALYGNYFDRRVHDSGAIMCGAGTPQGLDGEWFTNYGQRVSLQGWGSSVVTTCCGDLQGGPPEVCYTAGFNGTSSATPVVCGSVASLQGQAIALFGTPLTPQLAEEILRATGSPYNGSKAIGPRPNLVAARERLLRGFGNVLVTVRDGDTQQPMPDMIVTINETGRLTKTGPGGQSQMQLSAGDLTFHVSGDFYYTETDFPFTVEAGGNQEAVLDVYRTPVGSLAGVVTDQRGAPLTNARILIRNTPIDTVWTVDGGAYSVPDIPQNTGYIAVASRVPTKGAAYTQFDVSGGQNVPWNPYLVDAETFENSNGGYTPTGEWEWGTPTWPNGPNKPIPFSGTKCWGTDLDGPYDNLTTSVLTSPVFDLTGKTHLTLSFHHWMWIEGDDGGQVQVWDAAQNRWVIVDPVGGYPDNNIIILNYGPGYNGHQTTWEPAIFPLDQYAGGPFQFRLYFKSNYSGYGVGWYVDDMALDTGQGPSGVDLTAFTPGTTRVLWAGPNPTSGASTLRFVLGAPADTKVAFFDVKGQMIRLLAPGRLDAGTHEISWNGRDAAGRLAGQGIYLYKLSAGDREISGKLVRVR